MAMLPYHNGTDEQGKNQTVHKYFFTKEIFIRTHGYWSIDAVLFIHSSQKLFIAPSPFHLFQ